MKNKTNISVRNNLGTHTTSHMIVGSEGPYTSGDIMDANSVNQVVDEKINSIVDGASSAMDTLKEVENEISDLPVIRTSIENIQSLINADSQDIDDAIDKFEEIVEFLDGIEPGSELYTIIHSHIDNGTSGVIKHVEVLTQAQYDALTTKDVNTEYNIIESV